MLYDPKAKVGFMYILSNEIIRELHKQVKFMSIKIANQLTSITGRKVKKSEVNSWFDVVIG